MLKTLCKHNGNINETWIVVVIIELLVKKISFFGKLIEFALFCYKLRPQLN